MSMEPRVNLNSCISFDFDFFYLYTKENLYNYHLVDILSALFATCVNNANVHSVQSVLLLNNIEGKFRHYVIFIINELNYTREYCVEGRDNIINQTRHVIGFPWFSWNMCLIFDSYQKDAYARAHMYVRLLKLRGGENVVQLSDQEKRK